MYRVVRFGVFTYTLALMVSALPQVFFAPAAYAADLFVDKRELVILQATDPEPVYAEKLETVELGKDMPADKTTYQTLLASVKEIARKSKANIVKINQQKARSKANICDHMVVTLYKAENPKAYETQFSWSPERKLDWNDFNGPVQPMSVDNVAAATFCSIGFETNTVTQDNPTLKVNVFNSFYVKKSWVRAEEKNNDILAHEQGHFDLCELYTRKLRERMSGITVDVTTLRTTLRTIYAQLQKEYQARQQLYEEETDHGLVITQQKRWQNMIAHELQQMDKWKEIL